VGVEVGVGLPLKTLDKPNSAYEVGEVGVVQQVDKERAEPTDEADE
jgi:hypothetical protein